MKINAEIIEDSVAPSSARLTTFILTFPRFILPEFNTHRAFSRNASPSRAIPVTKQILSVETEPFIPLAFNKNAKGMQGGENLTEKEQSEAVKEWIVARDAAVLSAKALLKLGVAKQYANRILEPFAWSKVILTATEFSNFFALRYHSMAQPEICELAKQMWEAYCNSEPKILKEGEWHLPFVTKEDSINVLSGFNIEAEDVVNQLIRASVARCARVSFLNHEGKKPSFEEDNQLYHRLVGSAPIHASPAEHQGQAHSQLSWSGNFKGWIQYRKLLENENIETFLPPKE